MVRPELFSIGKTQKPYKNIMESKYSNITQIELS